MKNKGAQPKILYSKFYSNYKIPNSRFNMWLKAIFTILLFYFFVVLQNSFLIHFNLLGSSPDLVFIFFFTLIFFEKENNFWLVFFSLVGGLFLDIFSSLPIGISAMILIIVGFLTKKMQTAFKESKDNKPLFYFIPLFTLSFVLYKILLESYFWIFNDTPFSSVLQRSFFSGVIYNLVVASLLFYIFKKCQKSIG